MHVSTTTILTNEEKSSLDKGQSFQHLLLEIEISICKYKTRHRMKQDIEWKNQLTIYQGSKCVKSLQDNIGETLQDKVFLDNTPEAQVIRKKINNWDCPRPRRHCTAKKVFNRQKKTTDRI